MGRQFIFEGLPSHVLFGRGTVGKVGEVVEQVGGRRVLLLSTPGQADVARAAVGSLADRVVGHFAQAAMHTPIDITRHALTLLLESGADCLLAFGGGSSIGLGKALALHTDLPQVAIPTTYAGSEMTPILGQTEDGRKTTQRSARVLPEAVIYDADLTLGLPAGISGASGMNAIAHSVEGLYARDTNPVMQMIAEEGIRALARALPQIVANPEDMDSREEALYGAWLCGTVLGSVGMALHHKLCHTLGGDFNLPHAQIHTAVLPHAVAYNAPAIGPAMARLSHALGVDDPVRGLFDLGQAVGAPMALRDMGMPRSGIESAARHALENSYWNPRQLEYEPLRALIARVWAGERPY